MLKAEGRIGTVNRWVGEREEEMRWDGMGWDREKIGRRNRGTAQSS